MKIPQGWRKLRNGTTIRKGDKFKGNSLNTGFSWLPTGNYLLDPKKAAARVQKWATYIRKIK